MERVTIIIEAMVLPSSSVENIKADLKQALEEGSNYVDAVLSIIIR